MLKPPQTIIFCLFFGILLTFTFGFLDHRRMVFRNNWQQVSSVNIVRLQSSFWCLIAH